MTEFSISLHGPPSSLWLTQRAAARNLRTLGFGGDGLKVGHEAGVVGALFSHDPRQFDAADAGRPLCA